MTTQTRTQNAALGIGFILFGMFSISVNDMLIKFMSGGYPLHQIVFTRSVIGILFTLMLVQLEGGWQILRTDQPWLHLMRGLLVVISNMTFFLALAALPLAETTAIFFIAPLLITLLSIPVLGEKVGPWRLGAVCAGFVGVLIMTRPWDHSPDRQVHWWIYLLPMVAALTYACNQVLTRLLGVRARASAMALYIQGTFIVVSLGFYLIAGDGRFAQGLENDSFIFLLRAWHRPTGVDVWLFLVLGFNSAIVAYTLTQAYRMADAATIAPFEYVGLLFAVFWGWFFWSELPSVPVSAGACLVIGAGLFVFVSEQRRARPVISQRRINRRY